MTDTPLHDLATQRLEAGPRGIAEAARLLRGGGLVAFPTETVYGLGADAGDGLAERVRQHVGGRRGVDDEQQRLEGRVELVVGGERGVGEAELGAPGHRVVGVGGVVGLVHGTRVERIGHAYSSSGFGVASGIAAVSGVHSTAKACHSVASISTEPWVWELSEP